MVNSHVFVTLGDLKKVACDAWLLPTDHSPRIDTKWTSGLSGPADAFLPERATPFFEDKEPVFPLEGWPLELPLPVLTAVPMHGIRETREVDDPIAHFIRVAAAAARERRERSAAGGTPEKPANRPVPLLGLPLYGTGGGRAAPFRGKVLKKILDVSRTIAAEEGVDVVLVLQSQHDFALAQQLRKDETENWGQELDSTLQEHARELADHARAGKLVPFLGAGVSVSAGAPTWSELIARLALRVDFDQEELGNLQERNVLDQASILKAIFDQAELSMNAAISEEVQLDRYGLAPALLASLPGTQAITLNYDELYEKAAEDAGRPATVIPAGRPAPVIPAGSPVQRNRWLLKLHGTVTRPETIILTREDYLGFNATRSALSALVKANLITHHLLFVGFGLNDDHFHEILHDVRRAFPETSAGNDDVATALTLVANRLDEYAWKDKLTLVTMSEGPDAPLANAARRLEIFLDLLVAHAIDSHSYLLAEGYEEVLTPAENSLRGKLESLRKDLSAPERASSGGVRVLAMLEELGAPPAP